MKFSQRQGITPVRKAIQLESIDRDLLNSLWNVYLTFVGNVVESSEFPQGIYRDAHWIYYFKVPRDNMPCDMPNVLLYVRNFFYKCKWYEVYDLLEFNFEILQTIPFKRTVDVDGMIKMMNMTLERESAAYTIISNKFSPITNQQEIDSVEEALSNTKQFSPLKGANIHLSEALQKLSDRKNPDYRNSIKESISAVESLAKVISNGAKDSLGGALDKIKGRINIHSSLERGFKQIYGYTSDGDGIRHSLSDESNCDFEDAKFMLVSCSAFINYLIIKATKAGLEF